MISVIIPTLNEEKNITTTIKSIHEALHSWEHEVILVDNGSSDQTISLGQKLGAVTLEDPKATIGQLRNIGAKSASGEILLFIDADVSLDVEWGKNFLAIYEQLEQSSLTVTGSTCLTYPSDDAITNNWTSRLKSAETQYINSGHLVTTKKMFDQIDGFDSRLRTSEDFDFCQRARSSGGSIVKHKELKAYHRGYPTRIPDFVRREAWHGRADIASLSSFSHSRTAQISILNSLLLVLSLTSLALSFTAVFLAGLLVSYLISLALSWYKFGFSTQLIRDSKTALCFQLYMFGRTTSLFIKDDRPKARS